MLKNIAMGLAGLCVYPKAVYKFFINNMAKFNNAGIIFIDWASGTELLFPGVRYLIFSV